MCQSIQRPKQQSWEQNDHAYQASLTFLPRINVWAWYSEKGTCAKVSVLRSLSFLGILKEVSNLNFLINLNAIYEHLTYDCTTLNVSLSF